MEKKEIEAVLDQNAQALVTAISDPDVAVAEKISALRALTSYYSARFKKEALPAQPEQAVQNFASFQEQVAEASDGETELRTGGRRRN